MLFRKLARRCSALLLSTTLLSSCDAGALLEPRVTSEGLTPSASISPAKAPTSVSPGMRLRMTVGDTAQMQMGELAADGQGPVVVPVEISADGTYTTVFVRSSATFDAVRLNDATLTLGYLTGPRVSLARRQDGSYIKVVTGGRYPSVHYYFNAEGLGPSPRSVGSSSLVLQGRHAQLGNVRGALDEPAESEPLAWSSRAPQIISVSSGGVAVARSAGVAVLTYGNSAAFDSMFVEVSEPPAKDNANSSTGDPAAPPPPVASAGDFVIYANPGVEAILGPQLKAGAAANPWTFFDTNALAKGLAHGVEFPAILPIINLDYYTNLNYYDQGLVQYQNYYRTGDTRFLQNARKLNDSWYRFVLLSELSGGIAPRNSSMGGLMLRALDGRPELWPYITNYVRDMFQMWVGARVGNSGLYYGLRDGGYMLTYAAWLAQVHPDAAVRAEFRQKSLAAARSYYARLQRPDGGWYWEDDGSDSAPGGVWEQPFMVGLLLEGMIEVHEMTEDPTVGQSIVKAVDHLYSRYRMNPVLNSDGTPNNHAKALWRSVGYFNMIDGDVQGETVVDGEVKTGKGVVIKPGWDTNTIREGRQRNTLVVHAFGYAYQLTRNAKYRQQGDEIFSATYGKGSGPGADAYYGLADFRAKEYNQAYRSAGRYLAWRVK